MSANQISIIIPAYNEELNIGSLLKTLQERQTGYVSEIIVADGGSRDQTKKVAEDYGAFVHDCIKKGRAAQMNEGASIAESPLLYFLHADTIPPHGFDRLIINAIHKGAGAGCFRLRFDDDHPALKFYSWFTKFRCTAIRFGDQSLFASKTLFKKIKGFDESLIVMEDQEIVRQIKRETSFKIIEKNVETSARKYRKNGVFRLQFIFTVILIGYYLGAKQNTLAHLYGSLIKV